MMIGDETVTTKPNFCIFMPVTQRWESFEPRTEIIEVRFPGFLIIKHKELKIENCQGIGRLQKVLCCTVQSIFI